MPRYCRATGLHAVSLAADIAAQHGEMDRAWTALRPLLEEIAAGKRADLKPQAVERFVQLYAAHIALEEDGVFPLAVPAAT
jgi:hemerythrin-like domain-containing protein